MTERIQRLKPQWARDTQTGAEVYNLDREHLGYELGGRVWTLPVERGVGVISIYLPARPAWDDGEPLTPAELTSARESIELVLQVWDARADFVE